MHGSRGWGQRGGSSRGVYSNFFKLQHKIPKICPPENLKKLWGPPWKNYLDAHMKEKSQGVKDPDSTVCTMSQWLMDTGIEPYRACPPWVPQVYPPGSYFSSPLGSGTAPAPLQQTMRSENMDLKLFNKNSSVHLINNIWGQNTFRIIACWNIFFKLKMEFYSNTIWIRWWNTLHRFFHLFGI